MSKVRIVNEKTGQVKFVSKRVAEKSNLLKSKGWFIEAIEKPIETQPVKAPVEATPTDDISVPDLNAPTLEGLRIEYKKVFEKRPHHSWKEETLTQKIEDKKNE